MQCSSLAFPCQSKTIDMRMLHGLRELSGTVVLRWEAELQWRLR